MQKLATATTQVADGDYTQRVPVMRQDETGQLEQHFNRKAALLATSIVQRKTVVVSSRVPL
jgi:HAMP domain-containing protein